MTARGQSGWSELAAVVVLVEVIVAGPLGVWLAVRLELPDVLVVLALFLPPLALFWLGRTGGVFGGRSPRRARGRAARGIVTALQLALAGGLIAVALTDLPEARTLGWEASAALPLAMLVLALGPALAAAALAPAVVTSEPAARALRRTLAALAAVPAALALLSLVAGETGADCRLFDFDRARWASAPLGSVGDESSSPRERIASTLVRCDVLTGRSRERVRARLGPPDARNRTETNSLQWEIAAGSDDPIYLSVPFDRRGRAGRAFIE